MVNKVVLSAIGAAAIASPSARADFIVEFRSSIQQFFTQQYTVDTDLVAPGTPVSFTIPNANAGFWRIYSDNPGVDVLGTVSFSPSSNNDIFLIIGRPNVNWNPFQDPGAGAVKSWLGGVSQGAARVHVQASVFDYLGPVNAHNISRVKAGVALVGTLTSSTGQVVRVEAPSAYNAGLGDAGVQAFAGTIQNVAISGDLLGSVTASGSANIGTIEVDGNFIGFVNTNTGTIGSIQVGENWGGQISSGGNITQIQIMGVAGVAVSGGSLVLAPGTIQTTNGASINSLSVGDDFIGSIGIAGNAPSIQIDGGLFSLDGSSNVVEGSLNVSGTATAIEIGTSSLLTTPGISAIADFSITSMNAVALSSVSFGGEFTAGSLGITNGVPATGIVDIGDSLAAAASLDLPANGLLGNILINTNNATGQFLGDIEVGSTVLSPNYTTLSSALGAGAAGLAPYNFHQFTGPAPSNRAELSCNPHHTEFVQVGDCGDFDELNEVIIEHYGPIYAVRVNGEQDTDPQFRVEFLTAIQPLPNGTPWENVTHLFKVDFTRTSDDSSSTNRKAYLIPTGANKSGFNAAGIFRIRPIINRVKSAGVVGFPNVAYDSSVVSGDLGSTTTTQYDWYQFEVGFVTCPGARMFEGGQVASTDLDAWLDQPFEVNMDGETCPQDFNMMVDAYQP